MTRNTGRKLNIAVSTILLALFLYLAFRNVNFTELITILKNTNYFYVVVGISIGVILGSIVRTFRWRILLEPIKANISFRNLFSATVIGYMVNNLIPRTGELVRPYLLGKSESLSKMAAFGTIIIERIIDTVMFLFMFGIALLYFKRRISNAFPEIDFAVIILTAIIFLTLFWILFTIFKTEQSFRIIKFFTRVLPERFQLKIEKLFASLVNSFNVLKRPHLLLMTGIYSVILWLVYLCSTYIPLYSFGIIVDGSTGFLEGIWNANLLLVLINLAMFIPAPAATGPYHYVCRVTLVTIFSVSEAKALGYATSTHLMSFLIFLIVGLYYFITSHYRISELKQETI
ncbi:MAG: lysylphosphatidylglycerol synthase transmembrane domain-containing protein [Ignavibacteria bacterium]